MQSKPILQLVQKQLQKQTQSKVEEKPEFSSKDRKPHKLMRPMKKRILKTKKQTQTKEKSKYAYKQKKEQATDTKQFAIYRPSEKIMGRLKHYL